MKSHLTFTPEVLTCGTLYNHCDYYLTRMVIYEHLNILAMFCYNLHQVQPVPSPGFFIRFCPF
jgi:hypothetical protein